MIRSISCAQVNELVQIERQLNRQNLHHDFLDIDSDRHPAMHYVDVDRVMATLAQDEQETARRLNVIRRAMAIVVAPLAKTP